LSDTADLAEFFSNALADEGVLVIPAVEAARLEDTPHLTGMSDLRERLKDDTVMQYGEIHCNMKAPQKIFVAMKSYMNRARWFSNEAEVNLAIQERAVRTKSGQNPILYFDGATMLSYQVPSRVVEEVWCRGNHVCERKHGFDPDIPNYPVTSFEVKISTVSGGGRGVFAKELIPEGSFMGLEENVYNMFVPISTYKLLGEIAEKFPLEYFDLFYVGYLDGYGCKNSTVVYILFSS
jgi:hypothetical protein